jgi:alpha-1,2-mannosyltransferase
MDGHMSGTEAVRSESKRWLRIALVAWLAILTIVSVRVLLRPAGRTTYPIFSSSAQLWWRGGELYFPHRPESVQTGFRYCPAFAIMTTPFALFPDAVGGVLWRWAGAGVFLAALVWWARACLPLALTGERTAILALLVVPLALPSVNNGQVNVLVTGLLLASVAAVAEKRWNLASAVLALAFVCKLYPIVLGLVLVLLYPRQLAGRLLFALGLALGLPLLLQRPDYVVDQYGKWIELLGRDDRSQFGLDGAYRDLWLLFRQLGVPLEYRWYRLLQAAAGAGVAALCLYRQQRGWPERALLTSTLALTTGWMLLLGPAPESCTFILLAPSLAWAGLAALTPPRLSCGLLLILASAAVYLLAMIGGWLPHSTEIHSKGLHPCATLLWVVYLLQERCPATAAEEGLQPRPLPHAA